MSKRLNETRLTSERTRTINQLSTLFQECDLSFEDGLSRLTLLLCQKYNVNLEFEDEALYDDVVFFDANGVSIRKNQRRKRRHNTRKAKKRLLNTAEIAKKNSAVRFESEIKRNLSRLDDSTAAKSESSLKMALKALAGEFDDPKKNSEVLKEFSSVYILSPSSAAATAIRLNNIANKIS